MYSSWSLRSLASFITLSRDNGAQLPVSDSVDLTRPSVLILPTEVLSTITSYATRDGQRALMLCSRLFREVAIPWLFADFHMKALRRDDMRSVYEGFDKAMRDFLLLDRKIKLAIRRVTFQEVHWAENVIIDVLKSMRNLRVLRLGPCSRPSLLHDQLPVLMDTLDELPLQEFALRMKLDARVIAQAADAISHTGLCGLRILNVEWDSNQDSGLQCLSAFLRPSLPTLRELSVMMETHRSAPVLDVRILKDAAKSLRILRLRTPRGPWNTLQVIVQLFPDLVELDLDYAPENGLRPMWEDSFVTLFASMKDITRIALAYEFEPIHMLANDDEWDDYYNRSQGHRVDATRALAAACPQLGSCRWIHGGCHIYEFNVFPAVGGEAGVELISKKAYLRMM